MEAEEAVATADGTRVLAELRRAQRAGRVRRYLLVGARAAMAAPTVASGCFAVIAAVVAGVLEWRMTEGDAGWSPLWSALLAVLAVGVLRLLYNLWMAPGAAERADTEFLADAYDRALCERDEAKDEVARLRDMRPAIRIEDLAGTTSLVGMGITSDPPCAYAFRRIYITNHGGDTTLRGWSVLVTLPSGAEYHGRVLTSSQYGPSMDALRQDSSMDIVCADDVRRLGREESLRAELPVIVPGLRTEDIAQPGAVVQVRFRDGFDRSWSFGDGPMVRRS